MPKCSHSPRSHSSSCRLSQWACVRSLIAISCFSQYGETIISFLLFNRLNSKLYKTWASYSFSKKLKLNSIDTSPTAKLRLMGRCGAPDHSRISAVDGIRTRAIPAGNHWFIRPALLAALPPRHSMEYISIYHKTNDSSEKVYVVCQ